MPSMNRFKLTWPNATGVKIKPNDDATKEQTLQSGEECFPAAWDKVDTLHVEVISTNGVTYGADVKAINSYIGEVELLNFSASPTKLTGILAVMYVGSQAADVPSLSVNPSFVLGVVSRRGGQVKGPRSAGKPDVRGRGARAKP